MSASKINGLPMKEKYLSEVLNLSEFYSVPVRVRPRAPRKNVKKDVAGMLDMPEETSYRRTQNKTMPVSGWLVGGAEGRRFSRTPSKLLRLLHHDKIPTVISPGEKVYEVCLQEEAEIFGGISR